MKAPSVGQRVLLVLVATALLALSATMAWAAATDYESRGIVPDGVTVVGTDLGGMTEQQARVAIEEAVSAPVMRPVTVNADGREFVFDPQGAVTVDVDSMLAEAYAPRRDASFVARLRHDVAQVPLSAEVTPLFSVDATAVATWAAGVAKDVDRPAVDSTLGVVASRVKISDSKTGRKTKVDELSQQIAAAFTSEAALSDGPRVVDAPIAEIKPKVTKSSFGKTIVVDLSERKIRLFKGDKIEKTYRCAVGTPSFPTPKGEWEITLLRYRPTWVNPGSDWAVDMPPSIPPGPGNPLGTRAINLNASGIRFHGTENIGSVGTAASHGCMRMYRGDIEDLFERVEVGMKVHIVP